MRPLALALVLGLALPAAAAAQRAEPVIGGATFSGAPVIGPGSYRDTVLAEEERFYAIEVAEGQQIRVAVEPQIPDEIFRQAIANMEIGIFTSLREEFIDYEGADDDIVFDAGDGADITSLPAQFDYDGFGEFRGPGTWYIGVHARSDHDEPLPAELAYEFTVQVLGADGAPVPAATATATPTATPTPTPRAEPRPDQRGDGGAEPAPAARAGVGLGALALGLLLGSVLVRRRS